MALQIKELSVKVNVTPADNAKQPEPDREESRIQKDELVEECIRRVLEELKFSKER